MSGAELAKWADALGPLSGIHPELTKAVAALESGRVYEPWRKSQFGVKGAYGPQTSAAVRKFYAARGWDAPALQVDRDWTIQSGTREQKPSGEVYRITANFRGYPTVAHAVADFTRMLAERPPYSRMRVSEVYDPEIQALLTWGAGYATSLTWPVKVIQLIRAAGFSGPNRKLVDEWVEAARRDPNAVRAALQARMR